jgi:acetyl-CoA carboxylase biotin carboxyl carrier protein
MTDLADIRRLLDAFERSDWDEIHFVADGYEVHVSSSAVAATPVAAPAGAASPPAPEVPAPGAAPAAPAADSAPATGDASTQAGAAGGAESNGASMEGAHAVVSPSPGIFWRAPAPGEPPFVEVGQTVTATTPIGIVEVMKLMNQVLAGVEGTVRAVLVENGVRVERNEPMVLIDEAS